MLTCSVACCMVPSGKKCLGPTATHDWWVLWVRGCLGTCMGGVAVCPSACVGGVATYCGRWEVWLYAWVHVCVVWLHTVGGVAVCLGACMCGVAAYCGRCGCMSGCMYVCCGCIPWGVWLYVWVHVWVVWVCLLLVHTLCALLGV